MIRCLMSFLVLAVLSGESARADERAAYLPPERVEVLPLFIVPKGAPSPTRAQQNKLVRHLEWSQRRYREMLGDRDTFSIAREKPHVLRSEHPLEFYRRQPKGRSALLWTAELLAEFKQTRFNCPYVFVVVVMNGKDRFPVGGGRPINGGINSGGGYLHISSYALDRLPNFQSTLQHELGHAFGLPHVDVYRYDMKTNASIMAYNQNHKTNGFKPARVPGVLIPEDVRTLARNDRVFTKLRFDAKRDVPRGYKMARFTTLGPMTIPGHPDYAVEAEVLSGGEHNGSSVKNIVQGQLEPSTGPGVQFHARRMWAGGTGPNTWVSAEFTFPMPVELTGIGVHSQHSGKYNMAAAVKVQAQSGSRFETLVEQPVRKPDVVVSFEPTTARTWRLFFKTGKQPKVCIRGLRFFSGGDEIFSPRIPFVGEE